jgi:hypothetical protein
MRKIVHIGLHKTATTFLQGSLKRHRKQLAAHGLRYPSLRPLGLPDMAGHHPLARLLAEEPAEGRAQIAALLANAGKKAEVLLISTEAFYRYRLHTRPKESHAEGRAAYVMAMAEAFGADSEIVMVVRRPDSFAMSVYQESIKKTTQTKRIESYIQTSPILDFGVNLDLYRRYFARVHLLVYEELAANPSGVDAAFLAGLGLLPEGFEFAAAPPRNLSLHPYLVEYKRLRNYENLSRDASAELVTRLGEIQSSRKLACLQDKVSLLSRQERASLLEDRAEDVAKIAAHMGRNRDTVFPPLGEDLLPKAVMEMAAFEEIHALATAN